MASNDQISRSITPGSMAYGDRQKFQPQVNPGPGQGGSPAPTGQMVPEPTDPVGMLLSGALGPDPNPVTTGLSVGAGPGPTQRPGVPDATADRLRLVAQHAKTPMLRAMARAALRRRVRSEGIL